MKPRSARRSDAFELLAPKRHRLALERELATERAQSDRDRGMVPDTRRDTRRCVCPGGWGTTPYERVASRRRRIGTDLPQLRGRPLGIEVVHATVPLPLRFAIMLEMSERARKLLHDAMDLPVSERAELAADLLASLDGEPEADVEAAWASEIERRAREALANPDDDVAWETVRAELHAAPTR